MSLTEIEERTLEYLGEMKHAAEESDRGLVTFIAAQVDQYLRRILESFLVDSGVTDDLFDDAFAPLSTFSGKAKIAFALGLITKSELTRIDALRRVRNVFAHEIKADFNHAKIQKICSKEPVFDGRLCDRDAFLHMAGNLVLPLMYRDIKVHRDGKRVELSAEDVRLEMQEGPSEPTQGAKPGEQDAES